MKLSLDEMFVIQFLHGSRLQKKHTYNCIGGIILEVRRKIIHNDSIQVMILSTMDSIDD